MFLNSCYSESLGKAFLDADIANHVIAVNSTLSIGDKSAIYFSGQYIRYLLKGATRCDAFFLAKQKLKLINPKDGDSFRLMKHNHERINCPIHKLPPGSIIDMSVND